MIDFKALFKSLAVFTSNCVIVIIVALPSVRLVKLDCEILARFKVTLKVELARLSLSVTLVPTFPLTKEATLVN